MEAKAKVFSWAQLPEGGVKALPENDGIALITGKLNLFSPAECETLLRDAGDIASTGDTPNEAQRVRLHGWDNTGVTAFYPGSSFDWFFDRVEALIAELFPQFRVSIAGFFEGARIYEHPVGGPHDWHMDMGEGIASNRKLSITVPLSDPASYDGGNYEFLDAQGNPPNEQGSALVNASYRMHRLTPITRGTRYSVVTWVHGPYYR